MDYQHGMLTEVNAAVVAGDIAVDAGAREHIQRFTDRIVDGDKSAWDDFTQYLKDHQSVARVVGRHLVGVGYRFLDEELDRLRQIKTERTLNEEERNYALHVLTQLMNEITKLACKTGSPTTNEWSDNELGITMPWTEAAKSGVFEIEDLSSPLGYGRRSSLQELLVHEEASPPQ